MLENILNRDDTVLFIGAGVSRWSGLPSWNGFIDELASFLDASGISSALVRCEAERNDLLQAASYGFDQLTKPQIGEFIRAVTKYGVAKPTEIHRLIVTLGPRSFITTNYDDLIEQSLRLWQPQRFYRPAITNRQLTETAEIVTAKAIDFVYKPHGDASDTDSIILTKEQYRLLMPQGDRHAALDALKTLLVSRPVIYLGFGLRDPDFSYIRDLLENTYRGNVRDHYAIVPDVSPQQIEYWRRHYGIHLIGYETRALADGTHDHAELLEYLNRLLIAPAVQSPTRFDPSAPETLLSLARYSAALEQGTKKIGTEVPIRVRGLNKEVGAYEQDRYDYALIGEFLEQGPERALLIGLPGAGKTYALRRSIAQLAEKLHGYCLTGTSEQTVIVPIFVDLKLYRGNLVELINESLPAGIDLASLAGHFQLRVHIDSFNEMPVDYRTSTSYESDFSAFISANPRASVIFGSRTMDGLSFLGLPSYSLDQIDRQTVETSLTREGLLVSGPFQREIFNLLQKPFYFQLVTKRLVTLPKAPHPRDIYRSLFDTLQAEFGSAFGVDLDLTHALAIAAYRSLERGEEAFPLVDVLRALAHALQKGGIALVASDVANWLVSRNILIPYSGGRISFIHQSVTEFLAATELAQRYSADHTVLQEKLQLVRWDQALFLTLGYLSEADADAFVEDVADADFGLAVSAAKYVEYGRSALVKRLLEFAIARASHIEYWEWRGISELPVEPEHEELALRLLEIGNSPGAAGAVLLVRIKGHAAKPILLEALISRKYDYNFCANGVGPALHEVAEPSDVEFVKCAVDQLSLKGGFSQEDVGGLLSGISRFLEDIDTTLIREHLFPSGGPDDFQSTLRAWTISEILWRRRSTEALDLAGDLLLAGFDVAAVAFSFISSHEDPDEQLDWRGISDKHVARLCALAVKKDNDYEQASWALSSLKAIAAGKPELSSCIERRAQSETGLAKVALLYAARTIPSDDIFVALQELSIMSPEALADQPLKLIREFELDWKGHEALFVALLRTRDDKLIYHLIDSTDFSGAGKIVGLDFGDLYWWLDWLIELDSPLVFDRITELLAQLTPAEGQDLLLTEFNRPQSKYINVLASILLQRAGISTNDFSPESISYLLAHLERELVPSYRDHLLGHAATDQFVTERLLPLMGHASGKFETNLRKVLKQAGRRHGKRYVLD